MKVIGVHPIAGSPDVHLLEVELDPAAPFAWDEVTQEQEGEPRESWQAAYDEQPLDERGRWVFFFHLLDLDRPLLTPDGPVSLPPASPLPTRLQGIEYDPP
ncbi:MAG TPA: hypothetical protein VHG32_10160 [Thermoanaerobaculia bacterium]|jgi:hypothetical protein|nr:hypothetical protein [Thermoanaerobaculia bacterium]